MTIDEALNILAEYTSDNYRDLNRKNLQRRNQVVDMYGEHSTQYSTGTARFYISVGKDLVYLERFQFKLIIEPFKAPISSDTTSIQPTDLTVSGTSLTDNNNVISPNPHNHTITPNPHTHSMSVGAGVTEIPFTGSTTGIEVFCSDGNGTSKWVDITAYMVLQHGSAWMSGEGVFPSTELDVDFDVMQAACDMYHAGQTDDAAMLIRSGELKIIRITTTAPCTITLMNYLKYSHLNR